MSSSSMSIDVLEAPFSYLAIPFISIIIACGVGYMMYKKRRSQQRPGQWPRDSTTHTYTSAAQRRQRRLRVNANGRLTLWTTRSEEGLNELGEAPPPYDGKREGYGTVDMYEMELEAGVRPPGYPEQPRAVHTRESLSAASAPPFEGERAGEMEGRTSRQGVRT